MIQQNLLWHNCLSSVYEKVLYDLLYLNVNVYYQYGAKIFKVSFGLALLTFISNQSLLISTPWFYWLWYPLQVISDEFRGTLYNNYNAILNGRSKYFLRLCISQEMGSWQKEMDTHIVFWTTRILHPETKGLSDY